MTRTGSARIDLRLHGDAELILSVAVAHGYTVRETVDIRLDGEPIGHEEILARHGTRLFRVAGRPGELTLAYDASVDGDVELLTDDLDLIEYRRPSRYCESDALFGRARAEFGSLRGQEQLDAVADWVRGHLSYVPGSSSVTDGALATYEQGQGVCRDYAHLVIAILRALDVPARLVSMYAPELDPMDFHAVAEAHVDGRWQVVDATDLAPIDTMVRIATGRDAADTAFLTQHGARVDLLRLTVDARDA